MGKSVNPELRWKVHKSAVKSVGKPNERFLCYHIHYYMGHCGIENFQFDVVSDTNCEAQLIEELKPMCNTKCEKLSDSVNYTVQMNLPFVYSDPVETVESGEYSHHTQ